MKQLISNAYIPGSNRLCKNSGRLHVPGSSAQSHAAVQRPKEVAGDPTLLRGGTEAHKVP
jgi:hypothetical protein